MLTIHSDVTYSTCCFSTFVTPQTVLLIPEVLSKRRRRAGAQTGFNWPLTCGLVQNEGASVNAKCLIIWKCSPLYGSFLKRLDHTLSFMQCCTKVVLPVWSFYCKCEPSSPRWPWHCTMCLLYVCYPSSVKSLNEASVMTKQCWLHVCLSYTH